MSNKAIVTLQKMKSYIQTQEELDHINLAIKALEERPTGEWIKENNPNYSPFDGTSPKVSICPFCRYKTIYKPSNFCPNCGAKMIKEAER